MRTARPEATVDPSLHSILEDLKIEALTMGVAIDPEVINDLGGAESLTIHEYATTGGIALDVAGLAVNAPFDDPHCANSAVRMRGSPGAHHLEFRGQEFPVLHVMPLPGYLATKLSTGRPARDIVMSHMDRIRLSPIKGCAYDCTFCDLGELRYERRGLDELVEALRVAEADDRLPPRHVLISGGSPGPRHVEWFNDVCVGIIRATDLPVDVMFSPQHLAAKTVDTLVGAGVHSVSINLEVYGDGSANRHLRRKRQMAQPYFHETATRAVELLGSNGKVRSLIIPGIEPEQGTLDGIAYLADLGVHPVLSPFRPAQGTKLADAPPADAAALRRVLDRARDIVAAAGVALGPGCTDCQHNTLSFPWDSVSVDAPW